MTRKLAVVADRSPVIKQPVIEIRNLRKVFRTDGSYLNVIDRLSFDAHRGELICFFGRSGCGKSTLLKILADRVLILDKNPGRIRDDIRVDLPRPRARNGEPFLLLCNRLMESLRG